MSISTFVSSVADVIGSLIDNVVEFISILSHIPGFLFYLYNCISQLPPPFSGLIGICYITFVIALVGFIFTAIVRVVSAGIGGD